VTSPWREVGDRVWVRRYESLDQWKSAAETYTRLLKNYPKTDFTDEAGRRLQSAQQRQAGTRK